MFTVPRNKRSAVPCFNYLAVYTWVLLDTAWGLIEFHCLIMMLHYLDLIITALDLQGWKWINIKVGFVSFTWNPFLTDKLMFSVIPSWTASVV
jgi:hypothetical protein